MELARSVYVDAMNQVRLQMFDLSKGANYIGPHNVLSAGVPLLKAVAEYCRKEKYIGLKDTEGEAALHCVGYIARAMYAAFEIEGVDDTDLPQLRHGPLFALMSLAAAAIEDFREGGYSPSDWHRGLISLALDKRWDAMGCIQQSAASCILEEAENNKNSVFCKILRFDQDALMLSLQPKPLKRYSDIKPLNLGTPNNKINIEDLLEGAVPDLEAIMRSLQEAPRTAMTRVRALLTSASLIGALRQLEI